MTRHNIFRKWLWRGWLIWFLSGCTAGLAQNQTLSARVAVQSAEVFAGETFDVQIQVFGSETPEKPDLSTIKGFQIRERGGQRNSTQTMRRINGRFSQTVQLRYDFIYRFTAQRPGRFTIPAITVRAEGRSTQTQAFVITVKKPMETDRLKLRMELSKDRCYLGEPITLTVTWYIGQNVEGFEFSVPFLANPAFHFATPEFKQSPNKKYYRIPLGDDESIAEQGKGRLGGQSYTTLSFQKVVIPKQPGTYTLAPSTVTSQVLVGRRSQPRRRSIFDGFEGFFGDRQRGVYRNVVVPSNQLTITVDDLPADGRPDNFGNHVGPYQLSATANPTDVNVGDPITLTVHLSGPNYLEHIDLPPLNEQTSLARDFKIPSEMAPGKSAGDSKIFTQTLRAQRAEVTEIPPIELPYFDTESGTYQVARSEPIALSVKATRVVTAGDAEGREHRLAANAVEAWAQGIAHNYEDIDLVEDQRFGPEIWLTSPAWMTVLSLPPVAYLALLVTTLTLRRRHADPQAARSRKAYGKYNQQLRSLAVSPQPNESYEGILEALRNFLGDKLRRPAGALTFKDVQPALQYRGVDASVLDRLQRLFNQCEAGRYAGQSQVDNPGSALEEAEAIGKSLDRILK